MILSTLTLFHVALSLVGILSGFVVVVMLIFIVLGVLAAKRFPAEAVHAV